ncbi:hypothetical protein ACQP1P_23915 [Dactylosporangium sp. CA-052675]|uniref:hypothetical protein n=1 Tax=Dactylosporangium sp. CA-052675 TaxID=3239927 RepID=UPI003D8FDC8C
MAATVAGPAAGGAGGAERLGEDLAAAGLHVQGRGRGAQALAEPPGVAPRRPLLGGAPGEPGEVPSVDRRGFGLVEQVVEAGHGCTLRCRGITRA